LFCPHCGAPQLRYEPADEASPVLSSPAQPPAAVGQDGVIWKEAITAAVLVAIPVGLLSSLLDFGSLWVIGGGIATVSIYRRRTGIPPANRMGWRIGSLLGVLAAFATTAVDSLSLIFQRYVLHNGGVIDQRFRVVAQQMTDQLNHSNPEAAAAMPWFVHFWGSPDGTAAIALMGAVVSAFSMLLFAAAGGAIGARIASLGNRAQRSS
jgi:drug/metabolite transporter (DMT)-like permease